MYLHATNLGSVGAYVNCGMGPLEGTEIALGAYARGWVETELFRDASKSAKFLLQ
jgi:hypothetical protein